MNALRKAILRLVNEDHDVIGEVTDTTLDIVNAFNDLPDVEPIDAEQGD